MANYSRRFIIHTWGLVSSRWIFWGMCMTSKTKLELVLGGKMISALLSKSRF